VASVSKKPPKRDVPKRDVMPTDADQLLDFHAERKWLILGSLAITTVVLAFYGIAPAAGYPLDYDDALGVIQVITPVFAGYLGSATAFVFGTARSAAALAENASLIRILVRAPLVVFVIAWIAITVAFGYSNRPTAVVGSGMSVDQLSTYITIALGLLSLTTATAVSNLFPAGPAHQAQGGGNADGLSPDGKQ
jgi:hypothetical protein